MRSLLAVLTVSAMIALSGPAHGDPADGADAGDATFLASLRAAAITYKSAEQAVLSAQMMCRMLENGNSSTEVLNALRFRNPGLTQEHAAQFIGIAARSYCPNQLLPSGPETAGKPEPAH